MPEKEKVLEVSEEKKPEEAKTEVSEEKKPEVDAETIPAETEETTQSETEEETVFVFGDEEPEPEEDSTVIRTLRKKLREKDKALKEKEGLLRTYEKKPESIGPEPTFESCDMDEDRFKRELLAWKEKKDEFDAKNKAEEEKQTKAQEQWQQKVATYTEKRKAFVRPDFEEKEQVVIDALGDWRTSAIIDVCDNSDQMIYALGSNPEKLKQLAETNDAAYMFTLGRLSKDMKTITRKPTTKPEKVITGDAPVTSGEDKKHAQLLAESEKTGILGPLLDYRRKMKEAGRPLPKLR